MLIDDKLGIGFAMRVIVGMFYIFIMQFLLYQQKLSLGDENENCEFKGIDVPQVQCIMDSYLSYSDQDCQCVFQFYDIIN